MNFVISFALLVALLLQSTQASPFSHLEKRNVCDWDGAEPILYHEYYEDPCPAPKKLDANGDCELDIWGDIPCESFCQIRTNFLYGQEQIFMTNPYCPGPMICTISQTETTTYAWKVDIPAGFRWEVFNIGITGGWTATTARASAQTKSINLAEGNCGYFTFLPITKETCGSSTWALYSDDTEPDGFHYCTTPYHTTGNVCTQILQFNDDGSWATPATGRGDKIFVKTNCSTREPLYMSLQDPAYQHDGVQLPRAMYEAYSNLWVEPVPRASNTPITCQTGDQSPTINNCINATAIMTNNPTDSAIQGHQGGSWWASYVESCAVGVLYDQDWDPSCQISTAEIYTKASGILDACEDVGTGKVSGIRQLRADGQCNSRVQLTAAAGRQAPSG